MTLLVSLKLQNCVFYPGFIHFHMYVFSRSFQEIGLSKYLLSRILSIFFRSILTIDNRVMEQISRCSSCSATCKEMTDPRTMTHTHICVFFDSSAWLLIAASLILNTSHVLEHSMHLATCLLLLSCCNQVPYLSSHCLLNIHLPRDIFFFTCETNAWIGTLQSTLGCCYHAGRDFEKLVMIFLKWKSWIH